MMMPVIKKTDSGKTHMVQIDLKDVLFIKIENRNIVYHTQDETYYHISTLSELEEHLFDEGFDLLDKTNLVNLNRMKHLDEKHGNIYFEEHPTKESKFASIALIKQKVMKNQLKSIIAKNTNKQLNLSDNLSNKGRIKLPNLEISMQDN
ncbi:LytTR family DNA-binding domain-containing protein [Ferviditalea candida]|uniref:LytTR family DNA-binding domain-containing protein n=1 Tax=Ferviditalea candida TaxID=3108399 RepID=A0ABU5ZJS7_9BACL|nr:LytTR family DNA-binding domain-containing protein [Paenibacillaceae bacterium T2]